MFGRFWTFKTYDVSLRELRQSNMTEIPWSRPGKSGAIWFAEHGAGDVPAGTESRYQPLTIELGGLASPVIPRDRRMILLLANQVAHKVQKMPAARVLGVSHTALGSARIFFEKQPYAKAPSQCFSLAWS